MAKKDLPEDLVMMDILARLPVKSIMRFKCVCKSWYAMLVSPDFVTRHLTHPSSSSNRDKESFLLFKYYRRWCKSNDSLLSNDQSLPILENLFIPFFERFVSDLNIAGPCHGIVCLHFRTSNFIDGHDKIALWNPATREFKPLPLSPFRPKFESKTEYGIGFDSKTNDYKVVRICSNYHNPYYQVEVYTLSTDSWRRVYTIVPATIWSSPKLETYVKGFYYWRARDDNANKYVILSFDMRNEVFKKILAPPPPPDINEEDFLERVSEDAISLDSLIEFNGSLAAICRSKDWCGSLTIWVMMNNEYGFANYKWIKQSKIDFYVGIYRVLGLRGNGDIVIESSSRMGFEMGGELASYCPRTRKVHYPEIYGNSGALQVVVYQESLVPLSKKQY